MPPTRAATGQLEEDTQTGCNPIIGSLFWSRGDDGDGDHNHGDYNPIISSLFGTRRDGDDCDGYCNPIIGSLFWIRGNGDCGDGDHNHSDYNHHQLLKLKQGFSHLLSSISRFTNVRKRLFENVINIKQSCNSSKEIQCNNGVAK